MALDYKQNNRINRMIALYDTYVVWMSAVSRFYAQEDIAGMKTLIDPALMRDGSQEDVADLIGEEQLKKIHHLNEALIASKHNLQNAEAERRKDAYKDFVVSFDEFVKEIKDLKRSIYYNENDFDPRTGLKSKKLMDYDIKLEMERLSRSGRQFCLALASIDGFEKIKQNGGDDAVKLALKKAGTAMIECLRPFDDAYYIGENQFLLCLKQADMHGAIRAFERLTEYLENRARTEGANAVKMVSCIAEPIPEDNVNELIQNLHKDLASVEMDAGDAFTYQELSPLERYLKST